MTNGHPDQPFVIGGRTLGSRLIVGTGKYRTNREMVGAIRASGAEMVTVAVRRVDLDRSREEGILHHLDPAEFFLLPNTAGCYTADDALRYARLGRAAGLNDWVKLEVIGDERTLLPDTAATIEAAAELVADGFKVMAYTNDDLICALRLEDAGCVAVMPLASPIGSGLGAGESILHPRDQAPPHGSRDRGRGRRHRFGCVRDDGAGCGRGPHEHRDRGRLRPGGHGARDETGGAGRTGSVSRRADACAGDRRTIVSGRGDAGPGDDLTRPRSGRRALERVSPERTLAASILAEVESGRRLDVAWEASGASAQPGRAWIRNLVYGTVRLRGRLDHILSPAGGARSASLSGP